jgi:transposase-like protein
MRYLIYSVYYRVYTIICGGWDLNPRTPKGRDNPFLTFLTAYDLESRAFDQALLPPL